MSYSQNDEEHVILNNVVGVGRFLDVGAYDGKTFSNTLALAERGWGGVCVEPSPQSFAALKVLHRDRPNVVLVNALLTTGGWDLVRFWDSPDAVGTSDPAHFEKWRERGQYQEIWMPQVPLRGLLRRHPGPYAFVSIDAEGKATMELFAAMDFAALGTRLVCVECDNYGALTQIARAKRLREIHRTSENVLYLRE